MSKIKSVRAREIIDSRGNPTLEAVCELSSGAVGRAAVPSGASVGMHEALELRDGDPKRFGGLGVLSAVENVNDEINQKIGAEAKDFDQSTLDQTLIDLDSTDDKSRLGANATLGVSLAFARAKAAEEKKELYEYLGDLASGNSASQNSPSIRNFKMPQPMFNIINGGKHADSGLDIQEFMIAPIGFDNIQEKIRAASEIISALRKNLSVGGHAVSVGDEGGFAPKLSSSEEALDFIIQAIKDAGYTTEKVKIGLDAAASSFYSHGSYCLKIDGQEKELKSADLIDWYENLIGIYPIISIEDGLAEEDWGGFSLMTQKLGEKIKIVGDDLLVTNPERIRVAAERQVVNSVIIKPNQIGTLTETLKAIELTKKQGWSPFVSHRSGETTDTFITDLAVGLSCDFFKAGSLARGERVCKYNRLCEIQDLL